MNQRGLLNGPRALPALFAGTLLAFACDSGGGGGCDDGCGGGGDGTPYVYPADGEVMHQAAQVHVTQSGIRFLENNVPELIGTLLGEEGLSFCLEEQNIEVIGLSAVRLCNREDCDDGTDGCQLDIGLENVRITPTTTPGSDYLEVSLGLVLNEDLTMTLLGSRCVAQLRSPAAGLPVSARIFFNVDAPPGERVSIELPPDGLGYDLNQIGISLRGERPIIDVGCSLASGALNLFKGAVIGLLDGIIEDQIGDLLGTALCQSCDSNTDCPSGSTCNGDGVCQITGSSECVPLSLGIETEFDIGGLIGDFAPGLEARLGILFYLANYADMVGPTPAPYVGMDLAGQIGFDAEPSTCVPWREPPSTARYPKSTDLNAELRPDGGSFAAGIGLAVRALDFALWSVYNAGVLCLAVGSETVEQISTSTLGALLPSLGALADGENRPMSIQLRPQQPPRIVLGDGEVTYDAAGNPTVVSPLLTVRIDELHLDFYAFIEGRFARVFTLDADIALPLALDVNADNQLVVLLPDDLTEAIESLNPINGDLMAQSDLDRIATVLPGLIGGLLPSLTDGLLDPIDLPSIEGIQLLLDSGSFTAIDDYQMLGIFADLGFAAAKSQRMLQPSIASMTLRTPGLAEHDALQNAFHAQGPVDYTRMRTSVQLVMETFAAGSTDELEYSWRVNGGAWTLWRRSPEFTVDHPSFLLQGRHTIDVRVRERGDLHSVSPLVASTEIVVDYQAPHVRIEREGHFARIDAFDVVTPHDRLDLQVRVNGGTWSQLDDAWRVDLSAFRGRNALVEVRATDERGHTSTTRKSFAVEAAPPQPAPVASAPAAASADAPMDGGCSATRSPAGGAWLLLALGALFTRRRRAAAALAAGAVVALAGCGDEKNLGRSPSVCEPACESGQICNEGICIGCATSDDCEGALECISGLCIDPGAACEGDDDCTDGLVCVNGQCVTDTGCASNADCGELQICDDGSCRAVECLDVADCEGCAAPNIASCVGNACVCSPPCADGCAEGTACCFGSNSCVPVSAECATRQCPVGTRLEAVADPVFDNGTCTASTECDCVELPPLAPGFIGRWLEAAVSPNGSVAAATAYNTTYGDLMVGRVDGESITWQYIDGLPTTGAVTGNLSGPRGGIAVPGDNVGFFPSIAVENDATAHVAYQTRIGDARTLRYARGSLGDDKGDWIFIDLEEGYVSGEYTQTLLDGSGHPVIVFSVPGFRDEATGEWSSQVRMIRATTDRPTSPSDFAAVEVIEAIPSSIPCAGSCAGRETCRTDTSVCEIPTRAGACNPGCASGESCFDEGGGSRVCAPTSGISGLRTLRAGAGQFTDARWKSEGVLSLAHYDATFGILRYVEYDMASSSLLSAVTVDGEGDDGSGTIVDTGNVGAFPSIHPTSDGDVLVTYLDATRGRLLAWNRIDNTISTVDDGFRCYEFDGPRCLDVLQARVGAASAIAESAGTIAVVFHDATQHFLMESPLGPFGWEIPAPLAGPGTSDEGSYGFYNQQLVTDEGRIILSYRMRNQATPPGRDVVVVRAP